MCVRVQHDKYCGKYFGARVWGVVRSRLLILICVASLAFASPAGAAKHSKEAKLFAHYYNVYLVALYNKGVNEQNSSNPTTETKGIDLEMSAINRFDNEIRTIKFPKSDKTAVQKVLSANELVVQLSATLAINTSNTSIYNSLANGVISAQARANVDENALLRDLGLGS